MNKSYVEKSKDLFMNELIYVVHQTAESGLSPKEAKVLASD